MRCVGTIYNWNAAHSSGGVVGVYIYVISWPPLFGDGLYFRLVHRDIGHRATDVWCGPQIPE